MLFMIDRYNTDPEMAKIWTDEYKYMLWLKIELAVVAYYNHSKYNKLVKSVDYIGLAKATHSYEAITKHEMTAFLRAVRDFIPDSDQMKLHHRLTSSDIMDTALSVQMLEASKIIKNNIGILYTKLREKASKYRDILCMGRTHGQHASPITYGIRFKRWAEQVISIIDGFGISSGGDYSPDIYNLYGNAFIGKLSGPVGHSFDKTMENSVLSSFGLESSDSSTQIVNRIYYANPIFWLATIAAALENIALDIRLLSQPEIGELSEVNGDGYEGSSAMPHKRNPISSENICSLSRIIRNNVNVALENIAVWCERDLTNSANERLYISESFILTNYIINRMINIISNLHVDGEQSIRNIESDMSITSAMELDKLVESGIPRQEAYDKVKRSTIKYTIAEIKQYYKL